MVLVFSIIFCNNLGSFVYAEKSSYNYFISYSGEKINEKDIINALNNKTNVKLHSNTSLKQDNFSVKVLDNKLNNVPNYSVRAIPVIYAVYTIVVLGVTYTITVYNNGELIIKTGQTIIDATSRIGRAVMDAASSLIKNAKEKLKEAKEQSENEIESNKRIKDVLRNKRKSRTTKGNTDIYEDSKKGGIGAANEDFDKLNKGRTKNYPNVTKVGQLPDGSTINVRERSSDGRPTLEIQRKKGKDIKIRY